MPYNVKIITDSVSPANCRLTTWELTYPRFVHAELMTHRAFSRNAASSRAIPVAKMLERVAADPAIPLWWGKAQQGMQAREQVQDLKAAQSWWRESLAQALEQARRGLALGLHKQVVNRVLEPFQLITVILTATDYENFFALRNHADAQPEIAYVAKEMERQYRQHRPEALALGDWHLPLVYDEDRQEAQRLVDDAQMAVDLLKKVSAGRCARVSYLTHDGQRDLWADVQLHDRLVAGGHMSPLEHQAQALLAPIRVGNLRGWCQYRKQIPGEEITAPPPHVQSL